MEPCFFSAGFSIALHVFLFTSNSGFSRKSNPGNKLVYLKVSIEKTADRYFLPADEPVFKATEISKIGAWEQMPAWLTAEKKERPEEALPDYWQEKDVDKPAKWVETPDFQIEDLHVDDDLIATITLKIDATGLTKDVVIEAPELTPGQIYALRMKLFKTYFVPAWRGNQTVNSVKVIVLSKEAYRDVSP